jgi:hypothetical protein
VNHFRFQPKMSFNFDFSDDVLGAKAVEDTTSPTTTASTAAPTSAFGRFGAAEDHHDDEEGDPFSDCWGDDDDTTTDNATNNAPLTAAVVVAEVDDEEREASPQPQVIQPPDATVSPLRQVSSTPPPTTTTTTTNKAVDAEGIQECLSTKTATLPPLAHQQQRDSSSDSSRTARMLPPSPIRSPAQQPNTTSSSNAATAEMEDDPPHEEMHRGRSHAADYVCQQQDSTRTSATVPVSDVDSATPASTTNTTPSTGDRSSTSSVVSATTVSSSVVARSSFLSGGVITPTGGADSLNFASPNSSRLDVPAPSPASTARPSWGDAAEQISTNTPSRGLFSSRKTSLLVEAQAAILAAERTIANTQASTSTDNSHGASLSEPAMSAAAFLTAASNMENSALRQLERMGQLEAECAMTQMRVLSALKPIGTRVPTRRRDIFSTLDPTSDTAVPRDPIREMILKVDPSLLSAPANHVLPVLLNELRDHVARYKASKAARAARPQGWLSRLRGAYAAAANTSEVAGDEQRVNSQHRAEQQ